MYTYLSKFMKYFTKGLRILQGIGVLYFILFFVYWIAKITHLSIAYSMEGLYSFPVNATESFLSAIHLTPSDDFSLLCPVIFIAIVFTFIFLVLFNFIFIPLGNIEKSFVEKSFDKGEKKEYRG